MRVPLEESEKLAYVEAKTLSATLKADSSKSREILVTLRKDQP